MLRYLLLVLFFFGLTPAADMPPAAQKAVDKAAADIAKVRFALVKELAKAQDTATKKGDLEGALAIKAEIERQTKEMSGYDVDLLGNAVSLKDEVNGSFLYDFKNGHKGILEVKNNTASIPGFQGTVASGNKAVTISWSNGTQWVIQSRAGDLIATASDGDSKLVPQKQVP